jgi:hypothetical protein
MEKKAMMTSMEKEMPMILGREYMTLGLADG